MANENDIFGISVQVVAGTRNEDKKIFKKSVGEKAFMKSLALRQIRR